MKHRITFLITLVGLLPACDHLVFPAPDAVREPVWSNGAALVMVEEIYRQGEVAEAQLQNESSADLGYNFCMSAYERWTGDAWKSFEPLRICTAELSTLPPGQEATMRENVDEGWAEGDYRFVLLVHPQGSGEPFKITSDVFRVESGG